MSLFGTDYHERIVWDLLRDVLRSNGKCDIIYEKCSYQEEP